MNKNENNKEELELSVEEYEEDEEFDLDADREMNSWFETIRVYFGGITLVKILREFYNNPITDKLESLWGNCECDPRFNHNIINDLEIESNLIDSIDFTKSLIDCVSANAFVYETNQENTFIVVINIIGNQNSNNIQFYSGIRFYNREVSVSRSFSVEAY